MPQRSTPTDPISIQHVTAAVIPSRGARGELHYWRARTARPQRRTVWAGWATREEAAAQVLAWLRSPSRSRRGALEDASSVRTVSELLIAWERHMIGRGAAGQLAPASVRNARASVCYLREGIGSLASSAIALPDVEDLVAEWLSEGTGVRTVALTLRHLRAALRWGAPRGYCPDLRIGVAMPRIDPDAFVLRATTPAREHVSLTLEALHPGPIRDALTILSITGARTGEVVALVVGDYDRRGRSLRLWGRDERRSLKGKTRPRAWPVDAELGALLDRLTAGRASDEPLLDLPLHAGAVLRGALAWATDYAGVPMWTPHGARRLVVTELLDAGVDVKTVSLLTGHTVPILLAHYVRPDAERLRDAVERVSAHRRKIRRLGHKMGHNRSRT